MIENEEELQDKGLAVGQVWKNRIRKPNSVFLITEIYLKEYSPGKSMFRVRGALSAENVTDPERDLDVNSMMKMFPYLMFDPIISEHVETK